MSEVKIKELDKSLIHQANSNSMSGKRGDISAHEYEVYCQKVMSWNIPDSCKQKIVDQIYAKWSEQLRHEAAHVSVAVAGPARYNAKKLDHSDTILRLSSEFVEWFNGLQEQVWQGRIEDKDAKEIARLVDDIKFCIERPTLNPTASLCELANKDPELFMEYYEKLHEKYRWRKNSVIAKLYAAGKEGKLANLNRQKFFEDENLVAYTMGDRAYIKFVMKPRQQLIVALKSRKCRHPGDYAGRLADYRPRYRNLRQGRPAHQSCGGDVGTHQSPLQVQRVPAQVRQPAQSEAAGSVLEHRGGNCRRFHYAGTVARIFQRARECQHYENRMGQARPAQG